jgi:hypothetical protein
MKWLKAMKIINKSKAYAVKGEENNHKCGVSENINNNGGASAKMAMARAAAAQACIMAMRRNGDNNRNGMKSSKQISGAEAAMKNGENNEERNNQWQWRGKIMKAISMAKMKISKIGVMA